MCGGAEYDFDDVGAVRYELWSGRRADGAGSEGAGGSPFNIKVASLRLGDFTAAEVAELYGQHTAQTGQDFTVDALECAFGFTQGQPRLVNALAREVVEEMGVPSDRPITAEHMEEAKERLILARATHLDSLAARLGEDRVRRVIQPVIAGELLLPTDTYDDDLGYVRDLGLVKWAWVLVHGTDLIRRWWSGSPCANTEAWMASHEVQHCCVSRQARRQCLRPWRAPSPTRRRKVRRPPRHRADRGQAEEAPRGRRGLRRPREGRRGEGPHVRDPRPPSRHLRPLDRRHRRRRPFYLRIHSPVVWIEADCQAAGPLGPAYGKTRADGPSQKRIHSVICTPNGNDYGRELLRQHSLTSPHHQ